MLTFALTIVLLGVLTTADAQDRRRPRPLSEREAQLQAVSPLLLDQYWNTQGQIGKWCPRTGGRWPEAQPSEETKDEFSRAKRVICDSAQTSLPVFARVGPRSSPNPELFVFSAFLRDSTEIDQERYQRQLLGPFATKAACDRQERSFHGAGIGTLACASWAYK
ncbi:MAG TPA: hypothetical protein VET51_11645 [Burkholderiales bacterium]|nr:hypothetical protein [Burkholderiales bacterium]